MASVLDNRAQRLQESIQRSKENVGLFKSLVEKYNPAELKAIIKEQTGMVVAKKFSDAVDMDSVKNCVLLTGDLVAQVLLHLGSLTVTKKANQFDATTLLTADVKTVVVSPKKLEFIGEETKAYNAANSQLGRVTPASTCAIIASVAYKVDDKNDVDGTKRASFHINNELAPSAALQTKMSVLGEAVSTQSMASVTKTLSDPQFEDVPNSYVPFFPTIVKKVEGTNKRYPIITFSGQKVNVPIQTFQPKALVGDFAAMAEQFNVYKSGLHNQGLKRVGKNAYLAVPISEFQVEHVIALHDAGVKPGDCVMVMSPDAHIVSLLRSNFGLKVYGVGQGDGLIAQGDIPKYKFDWVYYPNPLDLILTGNPLDTFSDALGRLAKMMSIKTSGKIIMHINPLCFYNVNFRYIFKHPVKKVKDPKVTKVTAIGPATSYDDKAKPKVHVPQNDDTILASYPPYIVDEEEYGEDDEDEVKPETQTAKKKAKKNKAKKETEDLEEVITARKAFSRAVAQWHQKNDGIQSRARQSYGKAAGTMWAAIQSLTLPLRLTMLSYTGTLMYVEGMDSIPYRDALGLSLTYLRHVFKSIWYSTPVSKDTYTINRITRGTCVSKLVLDDDWSAMYSLDLMEDLEHDATAVIDDFMSHRSDAKDEEDSLPRRRKGKEKKEEVPSNSQDDESDEDEDGESDDEFEKPQIDDNQAGLFDDN